MASCSSLSLILCLLCVEILLVASAPRHNYGDALTKSILFFEGQRSGKLPPTQRMKWRKDSALTDGKDVGVDLTGGYYDAGDNVKFSFPMAFTITTLAWSVIEFGSLMGADLVHANKAVKWGTDYFLKSTTIPNKVFMEAGDPDADHQCWERPEDMTTLRKTSFVDAKNPGSEVSAEIAAALAASSMVFRKFDPSYSKQLLDRATQVFNFADTYRGSYNFLGRYVCPLYCDVSGYEDELLWAAAWIYKATNQQKYLDYVVHNFKDTSEVCEFGWDNKHAGIYVLMAIDTLVKKGSDQDQFRNFADQFICKLLPESPTRGVTYSPGGLLYKDGPSNMQHVTALSFLAIVYARYLSIGGKVVHCGDKTATTGGIIQLAKSQVDYVLGDNPMKMSYMVGYGRKYPRFIHHRGSSLPSIDQHPKRIGCGEGYKYFHSSNPNYNDLVGALVGGPYPSPTDKYNDTRHIIELSEPTTYFNSPFVGLLAFFKVHHSVPESAVEVLKHVSSEFF